jgi:hypothetical protein
VRTPSQYAHRAYVERRYGSKRDVLSRSVPLRALGRAGRATEAKTSFVLHIPKTGGTALKKFLRRVTPQQMDELGIRGTPHILGHRLSHAAFRDVNLTGSAFSFTFRDPTRRYVSAFYEMLRQGRPYHNDLGYKIWSRGEFTAFLWFKEANDLFEALGSRDDRILSAAVTGFHEILGLRWDHSWMLGTVEELAPRLRHVRHFCPLEDLEAALPQFLDLEHGADLAAIRGLLPRKRSAPVDPPPLSDVAIANLRAFRAEEYRLHEFLLEQYRQAA